MSRRLACAWLFLALTVWPNALHAQRRAALLKFRGPQARGMRGAVKKVLGQHGVQVVSERKAAAMARRSGAELDTASGRVRVARRLKLQAYLEGRTRKVRRELQITITVFSGGDGMQSASFTTRARRGATAVRAVRSQLWAAIEPALRRDLGQAEVEPQAAQPETEPIAPTRTPQPGPRPRAAPQNDERLAFAEAADEESEPAAARPSALDIGIAARIGRRDFGYNDVLGPLRSYNLGWSPSAVLQLHWYPGAHVTAAWPAHIGLDLRGELLIGVTSKNAAGEKFSTRSHALRVGLRGRIPLRALEIGVLAGFGQRAFSLGHGDVEPDVPDVLYDYIRVGADARYAIVSRLALQLSAAFLYGLSLGEIGQSPWFPHGKGNGVQAQAGISVGASRALAVELMVEMERYFMSLNPEPSDRSVRGSGRVAGGALDVYWSVRTGLVLKL